MKWRDNTLIRGTTIRRKLRWSIQWEFGRLVLRWPCPCLVYTSAQDSLTYQEYCEWDAEKPEVGERVDNQSHRAEDGQCHATTVLSFIKEPEKEAAHVRKLFHICGKRSSSISISVVPPMSSVPEVRMSLNESVERTLEKPRVTHPWTAG